MHDRRNTAWVLLLTGAMALGCASTETGESDDTGSLSLQLELANGDTVNTVEYVITRGGMEPMSGFIDTSAPGATASVEVFGLEPGDGYRITMTAAATNEATRCTGATDFSVTSGQATEIMVVLKCKGPQQLGSVRANGEFNICAELTNMVVASLQTSVGNTIDLSAAGEDEEGDAIAIRWTAEGGSLSSESGSENTFTCGEEGEGSITAEVSDDDFDYCASGWTVAVNCLGAAQVRVAHLAPEIPTPEDTAVDIFINGERSAITGLEFGFSTPFVELPPGSYEFGIAPAGGDPIFSFPATLPSGSITTVAAIRTVNSDGPDNPVNVLAFNGDVSGLDEGDGAVSVGHGFDEPVVATVDGINTNMCPPAAFSGLMFGTVQGPTPFAVGPYSAALAVPGTCQVLPGTNPVVLPVFDSTASLVVAVDLDVAEGAIAPAAYALIGDASGEIPLLPAVGTGGAGGAGGAGGEGGAGGAGGEGGAGGGAVDPELACDELLCAENEALAQKCVDFLTVCLASEDFNEEECVVGALLICNPENIEL